MVDRHDVNRWLDAARETERRLSAYTATHQPLWEDMRWRTLRDEVDHARRELAFTVQVLLVELKAGLPDAINAAFVYLERDPYYVRSGYTRRRVAQHLARVPLHAPERERARDYVLAVVDGRMHCHQPAVGRLAGAVADNALRRALRARLHVAERPIAARALHMLPHVRSPGMTAADVVAARALLVEISPLPRDLAATRRAVRWLWAPDWQAELRAKAQQHSAEGNAAKAILGSVYRQG